MFEVVGITLAKNLDGRLELLANVKRGVLPDAVWRRWESLEGGWGGWESLGKPGDGAEFPPAVARNDDGRLEAALVDLDGHMYHAWQRHPGRGWTGWQAMTAPGEQIRFAPGQPAFARNRDGRLELFAQTRDGAVWHSWQTTPAHGPWSPWSPLGDPDGSPITAVRNQDGHLEIFVVGGPWTSVFHRWQTRPGSDQWSAWSPLGAPAPPRGAIALLFAPAVTRDQGGRLELLARGLTPYDGIWHRRQSEASHGPWSKWSPLGHPDGLYGQIAVGAHADGRLVLAVALDAAAATTASQPEPVSLLEQTTPNGDSWSQWRSIPALDPYVTTDPALALDADQRLQMWLRIPQTTDLFLLWQKRPNSDEWDSSRIKIDPPPDPDEREQPSDPPH